MADQFDSASAESASALLELGASAQGTGEVADAERVLRHALEAAEREQGPDDPALVPILTALSTALLARGTAGEAEQLLLRLLALKRGKGEEHPEVATVLASLALARQALGRHDSAEQLWRRVVEIRERTLAPNHFATATALEHLGEACAARGKFQEGERFLLRALAIREVTLGAEHPSLRQSRERIADLQLQAAESSMAGLAAAAPWTPLERDEPMRREGNVERDGGERDDTDRHVGERHNGERHNGERHNGERHVGERHVGERHVGERHVGERDVDGPAVLLPDGSAYLGELQELQRELDDHADTRAAAERARSIVEAAGEELRTRSASMTLGGGLLAVLLAALAAMHTRSAPVAVLAAQPNGDYRDARLPLTIMPPDSQLPAAVVQSGAGTARVSGVPVVPSPSGPAPAPTLAGAVSTRVASRVSGLAARAAAERRNREARRRTEEEPLPRAPTTALLHLGGIDSMVRAQSSNMGALDSFSAHLAARDRVSPFRPSGAADAASSPTPALVIGDVPKPAYPRVLRDQHIEGDVAVRFLVDTLGRPVMSSYQVVHSSHALFADAVRDVIPTLRFEPARVAGAGSRARSDIVMMAFRFELGGR